MRIQKHIKSFNTLFESINNDLNIMIDCEPYGESQFDQLKYGVYVIGDTNTYYIGDIRCFEGRPYMSYLNIDRYVKRVPQTGLCKPNKEQMEVINKELDRAYLSFNLMDDNITQREFLQKNLK